MWAFAELGWTPSQDVTDNLLSSMHRCMVQSNPQDISNILRACVKLELQPETGFLEAAIDRMGAALYLSNPQSISNLMWACVKLAFPQPRLLLRQPQSACCS